MKSTVSIITVNYNGLFMTMELLKSLNRLGLQNLEIIVVDNASNFNPEAEIKSQFPDVKVIVSEENLGFAGGNNLGIEAATGDYIFFLNNDTELSTDIITPMVALMSTNHEIGVLCPQINYFDEPSRVQYAGFTEINPITGRNKQLSQTLETIPYTTAYPHGAAMMVRRSTIDEVGPMSKDYFLYYEELDWAVKIKAAGYSIVADPRCVVHHKESASVGQESPMKTFYHTRNRLLFMRRNITGLSLVIFMIYFFLLAIPKALIGFLISREWNHIRAITSGLWLVQLPHFEKSAQDVPHPIPTPLLSPIS